MGDREQVRFAVYLVLVRFDDVLMLRRANTGWRDGQYSLVAGHVDADETAASALVREAAEEAGVLVRADDLRLVHVMHRHDQSNYIDLYFRCEVWEGEPRLMEPDRADDMSWFTLSDLPRKTIEPVAQALQLAEDGVAYSEHGW